MDNKVTLLVAPLLRNSSCENVNASSFISNLSVTDVLQAVFIITLTLAIIFANLIVIIVINCRRYESFIHPQVSFKKNCQSKITLDLTTSISFSAKIFNNFTCTQRFSHRTFNFTIRNITCLVSLLALRRDILSDSGVNEPKTILWIMFLYCREVKNHTILTLIFFHP